jgi:chromosome segregation ATPase
MALFVYPATQVSISGGATEAKQDVIITELQDVNTELNTQSSTLSSLNAKDFATQTTLASLNSKDFATQTTLAALNSKVTAVDTTDKATATNQTTQITSLSNIESHINDLNARLAGNLVPETFDYISITYVTVGNGIGEIETVTYKAGGSGGTTVATLTLSYDANDKLASVTRT